MIFLPSWAITGVQNRLSRRKWIAVFALAAAAGCGALNPSFVQLFDPPGPPDISTLDNAPGHVVVAFANNAEVDERLLAYLESAQGGNLMLSEAEKRALRPRLRFRAQITFTDGQQTTVEFISGSRKLVQPGFAASSEPDLNENDLVNFVVLCNVAAVQVLQPVEVFMPVQITTFQFVEPTDNTPGTFRTTGQIPPQFTALLQDVVDADLNTVLQRNFGIRDGPAPAQNPLCGSVISIVVGGVLSVPFFFDVPGYDIGDPASAASVGGRYEFRVSIQ